MFFFLVGRFYDRICDKSTKNKIGSFLQAFFLFERTTQRHQIWHCFWTINDFRTWNWSWEELRIGVLSQSCATSKLSISGDQWWFRSNRKVQAHHVQYSPTFEKKKAHRSWNSNTIPRKYKAWWTDVTCLHFPKTRPWVIRAVAHAAYSLPDR